MTKLPREERLNKAKEALEAEISAHAVLKYNVQLLIDQFNGLNDASELATPTATSSGANQASITATDGTAQSGLSTIHVDSLATSQRNLSDTYSSKTQSSMAAVAFKSISHLTQLVPPQPWQLLQGTTLLKAWSVPSMRRTWVSLPVF